MVELAVMAVIVEFALMVGLVLGGEVTGAVAVVVAVGLATAVQVDEEAQKKWPPLTPKKALHAFADFALTHVLQ